MPQQNYFQYEIKGQLATLNEHDYANRSSRFLGKDMKEEQTEFIALQVMNKKKISHPCFITFHWFYSGRHDFDNIRFAAKYILDGMVKAEILPNDNQKWVLGFGGDDFTKVAKGKEGVIVEIEEIIEDE